MPRQNRVTPHGELLAVPDRGMFWGNRGPLLDREGRLARYSRGQAWVICVLSFKGRRRQQWRPGRLTELYFLDEATGLAAGHRPCGECRYREYQAFKRAWADAARRRLAGRRPARRPGDRRAAARRPARRVRRAAHLPGAAGRAPFRDHGGHRRGALAGARRTAAGLDAGRLPAAPGRGARRPGDGDHPAGHRGRAGGGVPAGPSPERASRLGRREAWPGHTRRTSPSCAVSQQACSWRPSMSADMWVSTVRRAVSSSRRAARSACRR